MELDANSLALALINHDPAAYQLQMANPSGPAVPVNGQHRAGSPGLPSIPTNPALKSIPAFLNKLYSMVNDPATDHLIRWTDSGLSFVVPSAEKFGKEMLPRFFKHQNFGSFVRQLNMYGFHKVPHLQQGVLKLDGDGEKEKAEILEFRNDNFQRDQPDLLYLIQRKKGPAATLAGVGDGDGDGDGKSKATSTGSSGQLVKLQNEYSNIIGEIAAIKRHQTILSSELRDLQANNRQLWQENLEQRSKLQKSEATVDKILKFLAGVFGGRALSENAGMGNVAAADSLSGLNLGTYGQNGPSNANNQTYQSTSTSQPSSSDENPRKRKRLMIEGSPQKGGKTANGVSQFEEIASDEEDGNGLFSNRDKAGSTGIRDLSDSPPDSSKQSSSIPISASTDQQLLIPPLQNADNQDFSNLDFSALDWPAVNAYMNDPSNNGGSTGIPQNDSNGFNLGGSDFLNGFDYASLGLPSTNGAGINSETNPSAFALALSPRNITYPTADSMQALTKYDANRVNGLPEDPAETNIKRRMDSLSEAIDRLVAQLPDGFDFSQLTAPNGSDADDTFDISKYLDNPEETSNTGDQVPQPVPVDDFSKDPLAEYLLDPMLQGTEDGNALNGESSGAIPLAPGDIQSQISQSHQLSSASPAMNGDAAQQTNTQAAPSTEAEAAPEPEVHVKEEGATPEVKEESQTPTAAAPAEEPRRSSRASKAPPAKLPTKAPAKVTRGKKGPSSGSPSVDIEDPDEVSSPQRRSSRAKARKT